jgi:hypothetical protein
MATSPRLATKTFSNIYPSHDVSQEYAYFEIFKLTTNKQMFSTTLSQAVIGGTEDLTVS